MPSLRTTVPGQKTVQWEAEYISNYAVVTPTKIGLPQCDLKEILRGNSLSKTAVHQQNELQETNFI